MESRRERCQDRERERESLVMVGVGGRVGGGRRKKKRLERAWVGSGRCW